MLTTNPFLRELVERPITDGPQIDGWNQAAKRWDRNGLTFEERTAVEEFIQGLGFLSEVEHESELLLDLATGTCSYLPKDTIDNGNVVFVDLAREMLQRNTANEKGKVVANAIKLPFPDSAFDCVINTFMMRYLYQHQQEEAIKEMLRVLKPGGSVLIIDLEQNSHPLQRSIFSPFIHKISLEDFMIINSDIPLKINIWELNNDDPSKSKIYALHIRKFKPYDS